MVSRGVETFSVESPVGSWKRVFFRPSASHLGGHGRRQLRGRQLDRAPQRRDGAVVRAHQRRVQQIAVRQRHPLEQARARAAPGDLDVALGDGRQALQLEPVLHDRQRRRQLGDRGDGPFLVGVARVDLGPLSSSTSAPSAWTLGSPPRTAATCRSRATTCRRLGRARWCAARGRGAEHRRGGESNHQPPASKRQTHHFDSYRGLGAAGKFARRVGGRRPRHPCQ